MLYIIFALSTEAPPFIDHYKFERVKHLPYTLFEGEDVITKQSSVAITEITVRAQKFDITKERQK